MKIVGKFIIWTLFFALITGYIANYAQADDVYVIVMKKQAEKRSKGWSLTDWMLTKKKMALMDQWLALHSSANIFEFFISGVKSNYKLYSDEKTSLRDSFSGRIGMYVTIFGLEGEYEKSNEKYEYSAGLFALRFFGTSNQSTNLTLHFGTRNIQYIGRNEKLNNNFYGARANLNIFGFLGLEGLYRRYLKRSTDNASLYGNLIEYGAFLDIYFLRLFGTLFREKHYYNSGTTYRVDYRRGTRFGVTIFM